MRVDLLNGTTVTLEYNFSKGYDATLEDPGCDDEFEIEQVLWDSGKGEIDIYPILSDLEIENIEDQFWAYEEEP